MRKLAVLSVILLIAVLLGACGEAPAPAAPAGTPVLVVQGKVSQELSLSMADLKALGVQKITAEHPKQGPQEYEGVFLNTVLDQAGPAGDATKVIFTASDGFSAEVDLAEIKACGECLVAIDGDTLNMVMPGMSSKTWVKTVISMEIQ